MPTLVQHIRLDSNGTAWIGATPYKVLHVIEEALAYGWSPEEIVDNHHGDLTLAQVHAAFSFYHDNQADLDALLAHQNAEFRRLRDQNLNSPLRQKLRAKGLIP